MTRNENRSRLLIAGTLSITNLTLVGSLALAGLAAPANAQGQNREGVAKTSKAVAGARPMATPRCASRWARSRPRSTPKRKRKPAQTVTTKSTACGAPPRSRDRLTATFQQFRSFTT